MKRVFALLAALFLLASCAMADSWQDAAINFVRSTDEISMGDDLYSLIDINGDDIPEVYYNSGYTAGGDRLFYTWNGAETELYFYNYGLSYIPGGNLFMDYGGHMDEYYQVVYTLIDGEPVVLGAGEFGAEDNSDVRFDANGNPIYRYYWNGAEVSAEAYEVCLRSVFDTDRAVDPYQDAAWDDQKGNLSGPNLYTRSEIESAIRSFTPDAWK